MSSTPYGPSFVRKKRSHEQHPQLRRKTIRAASAPRRTCSSGGTMPSIAAQKPLADLTWQTAEGIGIKPLYTGADRAGMRPSRHLPGLPAVRPRPIQLDVCDAPLDGPAIRRLLDRRGFQRLLQAQPGDRSEGPEHRLRPADPSRLRQRQSARRGRCRHGWRGHRQHPRHAHPVRRPAARSDQRVDDDERRRAADPGDVRHRRRRSRASSRRS